MSDELTLSKGELTNAAIDYLVESVVGDEWDAIPAEVEKQVAMQVRDALEPVISDHINKHLDDVVKTAVYDVVRDDLHELLVTAIHKAIGVPRSFHSHKKNF